MEKNLKKENSALQPHPGLKLFTSTVTGYRHSGTMAGLWQRWICSGKTPAAPQNTMSTAVTCRPRPGWQDILPFGHGRLEGGQAFEQPHWANEAFVSTEASQVYLPVMMTFLTPTGKMEGYRKRELMKGRYWSLQLLFTIIWFKIWNHVSCCEVFSTQPKRVKSEAVGIPQAEFCSLPEKSFCIRDVCAEV